MGFLGKSFLINEAAWHAVDSHGLAPGGAAQTWNTIAAAVSPTLGPVLRKYQGLREDDIIALHLMARRISHPVFQGCHAAHLRWHGTTPPPVASSP